MVDYHRPLFTANFRPNGQIFFWNNKPNGQILRRHNKMKSLVKNKVFLIMVSSDLLDQLSMWIRNMAILFFVIEKTNQDPIAVSLITVIEYTPIFFFSFIGGTLADRWNPKKTIISGGLLSIASIIGILICLSMGYWEMIFFATFISAIVSQFSQPSTAKVFKRYIPEEQVGPAIGISQSLVSLFLILGPVIGTAIYTSLGIIPSLFILIFTFGLSTLITAFLPKENTKEIKRNTSILEEIKQGFSYVWKSNNLKRIAFIFVFIGFGTGLVQPLEVFLITDRLELPKEAIQWLSSVSGLGLLIGGIIAAIIAEKINGRNAFIMALVIMSIGTIIEVFSTSFTLTSAIRFFTAFILAFLQIVLSTMMIKQVDEAYIGRTNGVITPIFMGAILIGTALSGILMNSTSIFWVFILAGCVIVLAIIPALGLVFNEKLVKEQEMNI